MREKVDTERRRRTEKGIPMGVVCCGPTVAVFHSDEHASESNSGRTIPTCNYLVVKPTNISFDSFANAGEAEVTHAIARKWTEAVVDDTETDVIVVGGAVSRT
jgi:hypothetical protein